VRAGQSTAPVQALSLQDALASIPVRRFGPHGGETVRKVRFVTIWELLMHQ
jgi:hypothetical protein